MDRLPVFLDWSTRGVFWYLDYCRSESLSIFFEPVKLFFVSVALSLSFLTVLTTRWGQSVVFMWLVKTVAISALITWTSIGIISLRFREAYKAQGLSLSDLTYQQPFYPFLPICVIVFGTLMIIAVAYEATKGQPFSLRVSTMLYTLFFFKILTPYLYHQNVVATYVIIILYIILLCRFILYERFYLGKKTHFISKLDVDFVSDAVWRPGKEKKYWHKITRIRLTSCLQ